MSRKPNDEMQQILDSLTDMGGLPIETLTPEHARLMPLPDKAAVDVYGHHFLKKALAPMPQGVGKVENKLIPGAEGEIIARVYTPKGTAPKSGWPVVVYFHGGGWVIADINTYDSSCRALCDATDAMIFSVHYRQAPEHKWPAAPKDAFAAYSWVLDNAKQIHGDKKRIAVAGESAGGNLATVVALMARDKDIQAPVHQLLIYPVTDLAEGTNSESAREHAKAKPLNKAMLTWFYDHYLPASAKRKDPYISPLYADLAGMPSTTIILAEIDPLRTEGKHYAERLETANVPVEVKTFEGVTHEFFGLAGLVAEAGEAVAFAAKGLRKAFNNEETAFEHALSKVGAK